MAGTTQEIESFFRQRGFGRMIGFGERPALIVIDIIGAFTNPDVPLGANLDQLIEPAKRILAPTRAADLPIFFSSVAYEEKDLRDAGIWAIKQAGVMTLRSGALSPARPACCRTR